MGLHKGMDSPELLMALAELYFADVDSKPYHKNVLITGGDLAGCIVPVPQIMPYTWSGFSVFLRKQGYRIDIQEYKANRRNTYNDFADVIREISEVMYTQKFSGAAVGAFNASIISADLGLVQKTLTEIKDTTDEIDYSQLSAEALEEIENARSKTNNE